MASYKLSRRADEDLAALYLQGVEQFGVSQTEHYVEGLIDAFERVARFPKAVRERIEIEPPVRIYPYRAHLIIYILDRGDVRVLRIAHGREDWES